MSAMHPVKLSPFAGSQGPKDRMFSYRLSPSELGIAFGDYFLHARDVFEDLRRQLWNRYSSRKSLFRGFATRRKISQPDGDSARPAFTLPITARAGFSRRQAPLAVLNRAAVGLV